MFGFGKKKNSSDSSEKKDRQISVPSPGIKGSLVSLEQRLMFDAAASATVSEVASEQVAQEQAEAAVSSDAHTEGQSAEQAESQGLLDAIATYNPGESRSEVVFVDPTVPNYQDLLSGMNSNVEVIMLDGGQDGIEQMANALSGRSGIDAIHVISHGGAGELQLGTGVLNADSMSTQYADDMAVIQQALSEQADILVYGCEFAQGEVGQAAVDMLAELTGADVQASTDLTGSISLGGDWEFEVSTGTIETSLAIDYDAQMNWAGILGTETVADTFSDKSYGNNDGTQSWSSKWSEVDVGASDANGGHIKVNSGELRIETQKVGASVSRGVNLSGVGSATLSFDYENDFDKGGSVDIRISTDGGKSYTTLDGGTFSRADNTGSGTAKFDISDYASANTKIQFIVTGTSGGDRLFVDNVQISYDTEAVNQAPTDLSLSANSVAENARTGTVVGTVTGTDPDARDTKTYSLTDTAGGRFAINASTGVITVADGSLLNYEHAASHNLTVQVTDSGGASYRERFTINLTNVNEGPTDLSLSANSVAENARTGTVVGTVTGTDPDARDTKTYSLTDTAGGRFAINASTGVITVADGSLLNYEHAASHNLTVQVTDSGGASYRERFTITLTNVNEGPAQVEKGDGGEQTLVASLFQKSPAWSEAVMPRASSPSIESDGDRSELWLPNELRKPVEWDLPAAPTVDILAPGRNLSDHALEGVEKQVGGSERKGHSSTASSQQEGTMVDRDSSDSARPESSQVAWQPTEETHNAPDNARDLAMPMMAGLVGAALQGTVRRKEKLATLHGELPTSDQEAATEQTAQEPNPDDQQAPPKAA
ncbi:MAG TPA: DUF4347 domain-containing protein [Nitrospira sp.]|nr:DUF4347 domain-containing protein [Nitrospira sp.]